MAIHQEIAFEDAIEHALTGRGWAIGDKKSYDVARGLDPAQLIMFVRATQPKAWQKLVQIRGGDEAAAEAKLLDRVASEIDKRGTIDGLRHGVKQQGVSMRLSYFKPAHGITSELQERYEANRLTVVRQLRYEAMSGNELDPTLFLNGVPVATAELKNPATNQTVRDAIHQYRADRDPKALIFARRAVVHFAVDPDLVFLTTRLAGEDTRFLPFNRGSEDILSRQPAEPRRLSHRLPVGAGMGPRCLDGHHRSVRPDRAARGRRRGQEAHTRRDDLPALPPVGLRAEARGWRPQRGPRPLLPDRALRRERQVEHHCMDRAPALDVARHQRPQAVRPGDRHHRPGGARPSVAGHDLPVRARARRRAQDRRVERAARRRARDGRVAHHRDDAAEVPGHPRPRRRPRRAPLRRDRGRGSLVTNGRDREGTQAGAGAGADEAALLAAEEEDASAEAASDPDELLLSLAARGRQPNLSYFAFTATPKPRTLEIFGRKAADDVYHPFHLYSMRQAIEEEFILDVLRNYTTYSTFSKVAKVLHDDPQVAKAQAASAIAKYVSLHKSNIDQRVQIMVEHFRQATAAKIGGRAKAMIVTRSRLHAVKYKQAIDRFIEAQGYSDLRVLVAFSGTVTDELGHDHTEAQMNGFGEKELPARFAGDDYRILVVAEKYQTGYDQPLLHTMYVDKKLEGVRAVQTLSRLNRIHPAKDETFVLDFANDGEAIRDGFEPFYLETQAAPTDPNVLFDAEDVLRQTDVIRDDDMDAFVAVLLKPAAAVTAGDQAKLYAATDPAVERWNALTPDEREAFRGALKRYLHAYSFLSQIVPVLAEAQEKLYLYGRFLATRIRRDRDPGLEVSDHVALTHLPIQHAGTEAIGLGDDVEPGVALPGGGAGPEGTPPVGFLSEVVQAMNERFGIDFTRADALFVEQVVEEAVGDDDLAQQAQANTIDNFSFGFNQAFENLVLERHASNAELIERLADPTVYEAIRDLAMREVYGRLRDAG